MEGQIKSEVYHERQKLQFCLLHALNNLFQEKDAFSRADLDGIAEGLILDDPTPVRWSPLSAVFKPHHNMFTGNYDVNVLIAAVERKGKKVVWHDRRNGVGSIALDGSEDGLMGFVLNVPVRRCGGLWKNRHWVTLRKIDGVWYNLDSDIKAPFAFNDVDDVRGFMDSVILDGGEILIVMNQ